MSINTKVYIKPGQQVRRLRLTPDTSFEQFRTSILQAHESSLYYNIERTTAIEYNTQFLYLDDEDDWVSINTEQEFKDALSDVSDNSVFRVKVIIVQKQQKQQRHHQTRNGVNHHCFVRPSNARCVFRKAQEQPEVLDQCSRLVSDVFESLLKPQVVNQQQRQQTSSDPLANLLDNVLDNLLYSEDNTASKTANAPNTSPERDASTRSNAPASSDPISGLLQGLFGSQQQNSSETANQRPPVINLNHLIEQATNSSNNGSGLFNGFFDLLVDTAKQSDSNEPKQPVEQKEPKEQSQKQESVTETNVPVVETQQQSEEQQPVEQQPEQLITETIVPDLENVAVTQQTEVIDTITTTDNVPEEKQPELQQPVTQPFEQEMQSLASMGFTNNLLNLHLLKHHKGDLVKVVSQLLELTH